jgi:hypothetical protein
MVPVQLRKRIDLAAQQELRPPESRRDREIPERVTDQDRKTSLIAHAHSENLVEVAPSNAIISFSKGRAYLSPETVWGDQPV